MTKDRNLYLSNTDLKEAQDIFLNNCLNQHNLIKKEEIDVYEALGRVTFHAVFAKNSSPHFSASAVDGIALDPSLTYGANESNPTRLRKSIDFKYVDTGDVVESTANSVIMIEDVIDIDDSYIELLKPALPWQHVRAIGEDIVEKELILPSNHKIRPIDIAALLAGGVTRIKVYAKPRVGIIPTGTELVSPGSELKPGDLVEFNSAMFKGMVEELGGIAKVFHIVPDNYDLIKKTLLDAVNQSDIVLINAGSSAGREDYTARIIAELGTVILHGVATKPGKPAILGLINSKPVVGIPGYPVSAYFVFNFFVNPLLNLVTGGNGKKPVYTKAILSRNVVSSLKYEEFVRIKLGRVGERLIATPLSRGAGVVMSLVKADGVLTIPKNSEGLEAGQEVDIQLLKDINEIENSIVSIGSHDPLLDILADRIHIVDSNVTLSSAHVGSMGGIMALKKKEAHFACIHLLDPQSGQYNIPYVKKYFKDGEMALIKFVNRIQGLMVQKGNPKGVMGVEDLAREDVSYINRQKGAGTRILLDYKLSQNNIDPSLVKGYEREEFTHMSVAAAVAGNTADCGLGVFSAAQIMGLDFIPIDNEEYDILIPREFLNNEGIVKLIDILNSADFKEDVKKMGGYDCSQCGKVVLL